MDVNIYLSFDGRCAEAFAEYARILGGTVEFQQTYGESPMEHGPELADRVMHARLRVDDKVIMGADAPPEWYTTPGGFSVSLMFDDVETGRPVFDALAEGGTVKMPLEATFWAQGFGMLIDRFGTPWMVNCGGPGEPA
jgi:PhnB protein